MADASPSRWGPNTTYIPPARVGGNANFRVRVGGNTNFRICVGGNTNFRVCVGSARLYRYQHVGIPNAKFSHWEYSPTRTPNARGFALQWNKGFIYPELSEPLKQIMHQMKAYIFSSTGVSKKGTFKIKVLMTTRITNRESVWPTSLRRWHLFLRLLLHGFESPNL